MGKIDWSKVLNYVWQLALLGGTTYVTIAKPQYAPMVVPALQAAGQLGPQPAGVTVFKPSA